MTLTISSEALATIRADVAASPGREACGLLLGRGTHVGEARACANVACDPTRFFEIDPAALLAAHRVARADGPAVLGYYHSHPAGSPVPSSSDAANAPPDGAFWLIVGGCEARLWRAVVGGAVEGRFDPVACALDAAVPHGAGMTGDCV